MRQNVWTFFFLERIITRTVYCSVLEFFCCLSSLRKTQCYFPTRWRTPSHPSFRDNTSEYTFAWAMDWLRQAHCPAFTVTRSASPWLLPVGLCEGPCVCTLIATNTGHLEGLHTKVSCSDWLPGVQECLAGTAVLFQCVQGNIWNALWTL
jgi:hypothetical protein